MRGERLLIVGATGGSNIGESLVRAARDLRVEANLCDSTRAWRIGTWRQSLLWRFAGQRPANVRAFNEEVREAYREFRPTTLIATGRAGLGRDVLISARRGGIRAVNFLTDDPFNPRMPSPWFRETLGLYDVLFTPRKSNMEELRQYGCKEVRYLPFAYDPHLFYRTDASEECSWDLFFAGHVENSRLSYVSAAISHGLHVRLYGKGWEDDGQTRSFARGEADINTIRREAAAAKVALCCVRHDNRDGHSMRTFELPAVGACMIVEDTAEHRTIFGDENEAVRYFAGPPEMVTKTKELLANRAERERLREAAHSLITKNKNTYADRLRTMLAS